MSYPSVINDLDDRCQSALISSFSNVDDSANLDLLPSCLLDVDCRHCSGFPGTESDAMSNKSALGVYLRKGRGKWLWRCAVQVVAGCDFLKVDVGVN